MKIIVVIVVIMTMIISCQDELSYTKQTKQTETEIVDSYSEQTETETIVDSYSEQTETEIVDSYSTDYLWNHTYAARKGFSWDLSDTSEFYGTWESSRERFIFETETFKYWKNKNNTEPDKTGKYSKMNNGEDLCCLEGSYNTGFGIVFFTPFKFVNNNLYLGFENNGVLFIKMD